MKIIAVNGWGLGPLWFSGQVQAAFPHADITVIQPMDTDALSGLTPSAPPADLYLGYSLGSLWLMKHLHPRPAGAKVALLAPVLAFPREKNLGGRISATQLRYLIRALKRTEDPRPILRAFYQDAGLSLNDDALNEAPGIEDLVRGLEYLLNTSAESPLASDLIALAGALDPLLDAQTLQRLIPALEILPQAGHAPLPLIKRLARLMPA